MGEGFLRAEGKGSGAVKEEMANACGGAAGDAAS